MTPAELTAELQKPWRHGEHVDARDLVLEAPLRLDGMVVRGFDLSGAHLRAGLSARGTTFLGLAWLINARIDGTCDLSQARFRIDLRAEGLATDVLLLDHSEVRGVLALARVHARRIALCNALIMANLTLENAAVAERIDLSGTEVMGGIWAAGARLGQITAAHSEVHGRRSNWT